MLSQWLRPNFIKVWCSFGKRHRTNNFAEGWHCKLNNEVGKKTTILKLLKLLYRDANLFSVRANQSPNRRRKLSSIETDEFIMERQIKHINSEVTIGHFLEMIR